MNRIRVLLAALHNPSDADADPDDRVETNLTNVLRLLDRAADFDPDVVCFPETTLQHGAIGDGLVGEMSRPVPGPEIDAIGEKARDLDSYVMVGLFERDGEDYYNAAPLIGPDGDVVGTYRKLAEIPAGMEQGIRPGSDVPVWDTDVGRIGACICWDARYPEVGSILGRNGADLVLRPTLGNEDRQLGTWALYNGMHVANCDKNGGSFYSPTGERSGGNVDSWNTPTVEDVDLQGGSARFAFSVLNTDFGVYLRQSGVGDAFEAHRGSLVHHEAVENGMSVLESVDPDLSIEDVELAFDLTPIRAYRERVRDRIHRDVEDSPLAGPFDSR